MPPRTTPSTSPWSAAAAAAPARPRTPCVARTARSSSSPWPTSSRTGSTIRYDQLQRKYSANRSTCPKDRKFIGFDAYKNAMDCLQAGRRRHPHHAAGVPLGPLHLRHREGPERLHGEADHGGRPDGQKMLELAEESEKKNLKVGVGLMCRHCAVRGELFKTDQGRRRSATSSLLRAYRVTGPEAVSIRTSDVSSRPRRTGGKEFPSANWSTRSAGSTRSSGPAAAASATS